MRTPIIAANWKMVKSIPEAEAFTRELAPRIAGFTLVERVICPAYVALPVVSAALTGTGIAVGAQGMHWEAQGAFTSQISPTMLQGLVDYVIIGHSETRQYLGETDETVNKKVKSALAHGLKPIVAVGESLEQNERGETDSFVGGQVRAALDGVDAAGMANVVIAYEPVWAIGTGRSASGEVANQIVGGTVRSTLVELYGNEVAQSVRIQYGGSVKPDNMAEYMAQPDIDGALVGGASLKIDDFARLVEIAQNEKGA